MPYRQNHGMGETKPEKLAELFGLARSAVTAAVPI
jgi:hypothetical protein